MPDFGIFRGFNDNLFGDKLFAGQAPVELGNSQTFSFTIKTDNAGVSTSSQFRMPLTTSTGLNMRVDWGDGNIEVITNHTLAIHTYASAGTYTISVTGSILGWRFANGGDRLKILNVSQWSGLNMSISQAFFGCNNLTASAIDAPLITSTDLSLCFGNCANFNANIGSWNVSNVTNFDRMFAFATAFNNGGSNSINNWQIKDIGSVNMSGMFRETAFNQDIGSWNTSRVTDMSSMFFQNIVFNKYIGSWDTSNVTTMANMFQGANSFNQDISTKTINAGQPNEYIAWNVANVTNLNSIFRLNGIFNQPIGNWNTSNVTNMERTFDGANAFNQPIGNWDTSNVTTMFAMFQTTSVFNQDIGSWNVSNVTNFGFFMSGKTAANYSAANLDSIYNGWSSRAVKPNLSITFGSIKYTVASAAGRLILRSAPNNWTITDGGI
jgi:surface protein